MDNKIWIGIILGIGLVLGGCGGEGDNEVVIYTALDQIFSEPLLKEFEEETGITVKAVYDVEATKTVGLVNRLIAEKDSPQCDVFWNNEIVRTIVLKNKDVLAPYVSPSAKEIPSQFKDPDGYWAGFAARARILIVNTDLIKEGEDPVSIFELTKPEWEGKFCLAYPLFGTTATHAAALFVELGKEKAENYFRSLKDNGVVIVDGNSTSKDRVAAGEMEVGFTDTDDANVAITQGKPVRMAFPDQDGIGTLLIPNTVCLIKNSPNSENGKRLIDYILSKNVESKLAYSGSLQIPLRPDVPKPPDVPTFGSFRTMKVNFEDVAGKLKESGGFLQELFVR
jgi:iron(III) transport system substrate-binding protein